ncbi:MAG: protein-L-isoaspartate O-methyltransferase [Parvibaculum sp.]|nr:protein-L-isoaspartate O-methyltransferase [Parvibaculum sp.]
MTDFAAARLNMVENQVRCNAVTDLGVIAAMTGVARETFTPVANQGVAYMDQDLPVGHGRYLLQARAFAKLVQAAAIAETDSVLDIGCATGYSTAILARMAARVVAVEENPALAEVATKALAGIATVVTGPLAEGAPKSGPYDVIFLNGSVPAKPEKLCAQLAEGGRLVAIIGEGPMGQATVYVRAQDSVTCRVVFDTPAHALPGFETAKTFVF